MYCYKVRFWDGDRSSFESGIVAAKNPMEAMEFLADRFGADDIEKVKLAIIDDESVDERILPFGEFDCGWSTFIKDETF